MVCAFTLPFACLLLMLMLLPFGPPLPLSPPPPLPAQIFRTASGDMTSPKSFSALVGKLKQQKASSENDSMHIMKQR